MGTFTGREVASRKFIWRVLLTISEWIGRKSGREQEREDFFEEKVEDAIIEFDDDGEHFTEEKEKRDMLNLAQPRPQWDWTVE